MAENKPVLQGLDLEKIKYLNPHFELLLGTILADREKTRARCWQGLSLCGGLIAYFLNLILAHLADWPLAVHVFLWSMTVFLAVNCLLLLRRACLPKAYHCPGEDPGQMLKDDVLKQPLESIMAAHAVMVGKRIDECRRLLQTESQALQSFANKAIMSPLVSLIPALVALGLQSACRNLWHPGPWN